MTGGVALLVILAIIYLFGLPLLQGGQNPQATPALPSIPTISPLPDAITLAAGPSGTGAGGANQQPAGASSLSPQPTQTLPPDAGLIIQIQKSAPDPVVTVTLAGGAGKPVVKEIEARLTRSDGQVIKGYIKPGQGILEVTLQGTRQTDRIEIIVTQYSGNQYRIRDELLAYRTRQ